MKPTFFATPDAFRAWLARNHQRADELLVGFYKRGSGRASLTWPESVDEALCFGWIDGVRKRIDDESYTIRFTPRRPRSIWSAINIARVKELEARGLMQPAGKTAFGARTDNRSAVYSHERRKAAKLEPAQQKALRANKAAWAYFERQAPWYQRACVHWVVSAKKEATRASRLATLIASSQAGRPVPPLIRPTGK